MPLYRHFSEFVVQRYLEYNGYFVRTNAIGLYEGTLLPEIDIVAVSVCRPFHSECTSAEQGMFCPESQGNGQFLLGSVKFVRRVTAGHIPTREEVESICEHCSSACDRSRRCALKNLFRQDVLQWSSWAFGIEDQSLIRRVLFVRTLNNEAKNRLRNINVYFKDFRSIFQEMYERLTTFTPKFGRETTDEFISLIGWLRESGLLMQ